MTQAKLKPVAELVGTSSFRYPNESADYRRARDALLIEEIELRRHIERVAEQRRALPEGGEVTKNYTFVGENGAASLSASMKYWRISGRMNSSRKRRCPITG